MPLVFQQDINANCKLAFWKVEEPLSFFETSGFITPKINHPQRKRMHAAGRFLLRHAFPQLDPESVLILPNGKPALHHSDFHFSISHSSDMVAVIGSDQPIGIDLELDGEKAHRLSSRFCEVEEAALGKRHFPESLQSFHLLLWTLKEAAYKCHGHAGIRFREQIRLTSLQKTALGFKSSLVLFPKQSTPIELQGYSNMVENGWLSWTIA